MRRLRVAMLVAVVALVWSSVPRRRRSAWPPRTDPARRRERLRPDTSPSARSPSPTAPSCPAPGAGRSSAAVGSEWRRVPARSRSVSPIFPPATPRSPPWARSSPTRVAPATARRAGRRLRGHVRRPPAAPQPAARRPAGDRPQRADQLPDAAEPDGRLRPGGGCVRGPARRPVRPLRLGAQSADDLSAVISALQVGPVDLYGDSYGTFFAQVFLGRHPGQLRSVVLDSAYPTSGEDAWYETQSPAMTSSFAKVCARTPSCAALRRLDHRAADPAARRRTTQAVARQGNWSGWRRCTRSPSIAAELDYMAFDATFTQAIYRGVRPARAGRARRRHGADRPAGRRAGLRRWRRPGRTPTARAWTQRSPARTTRSSTT